MLSACSSPEADTLVTDFESSASGNVLATCISQNYESAFPRFFPDEEGTSQRVFKTHNGITVAIADGAERRRITVSSPQALTSNQANYIRRCIAMSEAA
tara:strand:- start:2353 stop:2649 length:297 start_codon:yes stop_codon:yes gene_type:complete